MTCRPSMPGQAQVGDQDVEGELGEPLEGLLAAAGLLDDEAVVGQPLRDRLAQRLLVVHDQQMFQAFSHLADRRVRRTRRNFEAFLGWQHPGILTPPASA
jgi:hypothetical protein